MRHCAITFEKNTVTKSAAPDLMRVEVEKTRRAHEIGKDCGLFRAPRVLDYDDAKGMAVFERIHGLVGIRPYIAFGDPDYRIIDNLANALRVIHREMKLPAELVIPLPSEYRATNEVFLHGDLSVDNVCTVEGTLPLVIIDWNTTPLHGGRATYGTRYFDLAWFLHNLFNRPSYKVLFSDPITPVARRFVDVYAEGAGDCFQDVEFALYLKHFFEVELPLVGSQVYWKIKAFLPRSHFLLRRFMRSLAAESSRKSRGQSEYSGRGKE
jgi:hypothetical protein